MTNLGPTRKQLQTGVRVASDNFGKMRHIHLRHLEVHDVNGDLSKKHEGCGIFFESKGDGSCLDDLLIEDCHVFHVDRNGICQRTPKHGTHSLHVVIRGNLLEDIGGDGIKAWGSDAPLIEHNVIHGCRTRAQDAAAGIWPFDCNDALIQFNEVSGTKGNVDGEGFDSDYRCRRSIFQYNYSHDNEGGFMLVCSPGNSYCTDTVIRYNISQNDGLGFSRVFYFGGGSDNTSIYNNVIYVGAGKKLPLIDCGTWDGGKPKNMRFYNNVFYVDGTVTYRWQKNESARRFRAQRFLWKPREPAARSRGPSDQTAPGQSRQRRLGSRFPRGL